MTANLNFEPSRWPLEAVPAEVGDHLPPEALRATTRAAQAPTAASCRRTEPIIVFAFDVFALVMAWLLAVGSISVAWVYVAATVTLLWFSGSYHARLTLSVLPRVPRLVALATVPLLVLSPLLPTTVLTTDFLWTVAAMAVAIVASRAVSYSVIRLLRRRGLLRDGILIMGVGKVGCELARRMQSQPEYGLTPIGFVDEPFNGDHSEFPVPFLGHIEHLDALLAEFEVSRMIVAFGPHQEASWISVMRSAILADVEVHVVPRFFDLATMPHDADMDEIWGIPLYRVRRSALRTATWRIKRVCDVVLASLGLVLAAPVLATVAAAVRLSSPGPVLFRQSRIGQHGRPFELLKFRSMRADHDDEATWAGNHSSDQTRVGRWIRATSLDELPQLWNVLRGDMSLIGPRPERPQFASQFGAAIPGYADRHRLPVGLTGWAQVNGLRGDTSIPERARFDNFYVEHWSPWFDLMILLRTVSAVIRDFLRRNPATTLDQPGPAMDDQQQVDAKVTAFRRRTR